MSEATTSSRTGATAAGGEHQNGRAEASRGLPIVLEELTKVYPGSEEPAVDSVSMELPAGEIVILVGPSGCGKTTTMRMINRLIEPSSGRILLGEEDVTRIDATELRRRIGYVIQQIGLFPHMTIAQNVALVPKLLKWDRDRVQSRVNDMLELVGLDPGQFGGRYPRQLSGGQQQRVGVARALAADPPIMLMDEPFGAVDPITRTRLQDEFLSLQREIRKTIVFVTHDFDEAIKMGDRIAVLQQGSRIAQYATPEEILTNPANEFVEGFVGRGAALKRLSLERVSDLHLRDVAQAPEGALAIGLQATLHDALDRILGAGEEVLAVVDANDQRIGALAIDDVLNRLRELREESEGTIGESAS